MKQITKRQDVNKRRKRVYYPYYNKKLIKQNIKETATVIKVGITIGVVMHGTVSQVHGTSNTLENAGGRGVSWISQ